MRPILCIALLALAGCASVPPAPVSAPSASGERAAGHAAKMVGKPYRFGGSSPGTGFDCSGLVAHVFERAWGLVLPHSARAQSRTGKPVRFADLLPGDLVFYNTRNRPYSHVGIYLGEGRFVHAPRRGARVRIESVYTRYWRQRFNGARRLEQPRA